MATEEVNKPPSLPPYPEMILKALEALNEQNGSNKSSISKYIESTYGDLLAGHSALLSYHLNIMKESGELVFWKNNYMKRDPDAPPRRGRGRPPKPKDHLAPSSASTVLAPTTRSRGRPPKDPTAPPKPSKAKVSSGTGKPRGRPRKMARPTGGLDGAAVTAGTTTSPSGKPRGRPPKLKASLTEVSVQQ
ncbi:HMG-Y-related protein A [Quillaja saponaria]|uniref:HMG-Y-related protein A n=1 Tax=Quillaja saponaria TaxID=32244 RepID=A0AAD7LLJ4_QUISA|nr:HMG-Y-related protein A [Quillaja saponaria]